MVFQATKDKMATAAVTEDGRGVLMVMSGEENFSRGSGWSSGELRHSVPAAPRGSDAADPEPAHPCSCARATVSPSTTSTISMTSPARRHGDQCP